MPNPPLDKEYFDWLVRHPNEDVVEALAEYLLERYDNPIAELGLLQMLPTLH